MGFADWRAAFAPKQKMPGRIPLKIETFDGTRGFEK